MSISRRLFFGSVLGVGAASSIQIDAERAPEVIQPDDVLIVELDEELSDEGLENIKHAVSHTIPGVKVLVLPRGVSAGLLRPIAAEAVAREWDAHLREAEHRFIHGTGDPKRRPVGFLNSEDRA